MAPSWGFLRPSWLQVEGSWGHLGSKLGQVEPSGRQNGAKLAILAPSWWFLKQFEAKTQKVPKVQYVSHFWGVGAPKLELCWSYVGAMLGYVGPFWLPSCHLKRHFGHLAGMLWQLGHWKKELGHSKRHLASTVGQKVPSRGSGSERHARG